MSALDENRGGKTNKATVATPSSRPVVRLLRLLPSLSLTVFSDARRRVAHREVSHFDSAVGSCRGAGSVAADVGNSRAGANENLLTTLFSQLLSVRVGTQCERTTLGRGERRSGWEVEPHVMTLRLSNHRCDTLYRLPHCSRSHPKLHDNLFYQ